MYKTNNLNCNLMIVNYQLGNCSTFFHHIHEQTLNLQWKDRRQSQDFIRINI